MCTSVAFWHQFSSHYFFKMSEYDASPVLKQKSESSKPKQTRKYAERMAFSKIVQSKRVPGETPGWRCCDDDFTELRDIHRHIAQNHSDAVDSAARIILENGDTDARWSLIRGVKRKSNDSDKDDKTGEFPTHFSETDVFPWLPRRPKESEIASDRPGRVLLFYKYREIEATEHVRAWQEELCSRLNLTGKIRVAKEGLNATVGGSHDETKLYMEAVTAHPLFDDMTAEDFKESEGGSDSFGDGLKVGVHGEVVPMGVDPAEVSFSHAGKHLNPDEFHEALEQHLSNKDSTSVFVDCRNFYESKIGCFKGAIAPDIRKFSYWPEYLEKNREFFKDKSVYMYCTGGIRCERGSAYLRQKNICQNVYQLKGGIHKYLEQYPDGFFRGKLFVFDDRFAIKSNDVISKCTYCGRPWDEYRPCSSPRCRQLVLSCSACRDAGLSACCATCGRKHRQQQQQRKGGAATLELKEECECTRNRDRVPVEGKQAADVETGSSQDASLKGNAGDAGLDT